MKSPTAEDAANIQATELGSYTKDLYEAIERGDYPEWELQVQMMSDGEHPELGFDPLDDTKLWPEEQFPPKPVGTMVLNRTVTNFFAEAEQLAFGTGVLLDGLEFSDDKMLVGRTFSYSDTQRHRVGPNYLQLSVNQPKNAKVATNQHDGQMAYSVDLAEGANPHVNYEPTKLGGPQESERVGSAEVGPDERTGDRRALSSGCTSIGVRRVRALPPQSATGPVFVSLSAGSAAGDRGYPRIRSEVRGPSRKRQR